MFHDLSVCQRFITLTKFHLFGLFLAIFDVRFSSPLTKSPEALRALNTRKQLSPSFHITLCHYFADLLFALVRLRYFLQANPLDVLLVAGHYTFADKRIGVAVVHVKLRTGWRLLFFRGLLQL